MDVDGSRMLLDTLGDIYQNEQKIRQVRLSGLSRGEQRKFMESATVDLAANVERRKSALIEKHLDILDKLQRDYQRREEAAGPNEINKRLLALRESQLDLSHVDETMAVADLERMKSTGYSRAQLEVLASKSPQARLKASEIQRNLPQFAANPEGLRATQSIKMLGESAGR